MHWRLIVNADPGAGYLNPGAGDRGPFSRLAARLDLARAHPQTVIIQGGHDDIGRRLPLIRTRVRGLIAAIRRAAPSARLVLLTVFPRGNDPSAAVWATDQAIVNAARQADPAVLIFDPLAGHWHFPRIGDHLHPTRPATGGAPGGWPRACAGIKSQPDPSGSLRCFAFWAAAMLAAPNLFSEGGASPFLCNSCWAHRGNCTRSTGRDKAEGGAAAYPTPPPTKAVLPIWQAAAT